MRGGAGCGDREQVPGANAVGAEGRDGSRRAQVRSSGSCSPRPSSCWPLPATALWWARHGVHLLRSAGGLRSCWNGAISLSALPDSEFGQRASGWPLAGFMRPSAAPACCCSTTQKLFIPVLAAVIGTDIGAYFAGRTIGGPKIAPAISPSKTWAGLFGGMVGAAVCWAFFAIDAIAGASPGHSGRSPDRSRCREPRCCCSDG